MLVPHGHPGTQASLIGLDTCWTMGSWTMLLVAAQPSLGILPYEVEYNYDLNAAHTRDFLDWTKLVCLPELHESNPACRELQMKQKSEQCWFSGKNSSLWVFYTVHESVGDLWHRANLHQFLQHSDFSSCLDQDCLRERALLAEPNRLEHDTWPCSSPSALGFLERFSTLSATQGAPALLHQ